MPMPLNQLLPEAASSTLIRELTLDSRKVRPGDLFLAVPLPVAPPPWPMRPKAQP